MLLGRAKAGAACAYFAIKKLEVVGGDLLFHGNVGVKGQHGGNYGTQADLTDYLKNAPKALLVFAKYLDVVVGESDGTHPNGREQQQLNVDVAQVGDQQNRNNNGCQNNESAHGRGAGLTELALETKVANAFTHLQLAQYLDKPTAKGQADGERQQNGKARPKG